VAQDKGQGMASRHSIERKSHIGMTDTTARNLDNNFVRTRIKDREFTRLQRSVGCLQLESMRPSNAAHRRPLDVTETVAELRGA
jgi:hypothetical protein